LDEAHRFRMSGIPISRFRKTNGTLDKMDSHNYNMHMASCTLRLEAQYKSILKPTPLGNEIEDLHWILCFLDSSFLLTLLLPPDIFDNTPNIENNWVTDGSNVSGTERGPGFTPVGDPYKKGPEF
jgi:hypothetical protein